MSGEEIHGNDVEGVLAFKQPWPSMARTVWGAHKRYMDTYLNVYKGYYVSTLSTASTMPSNVRSLPEMVLDAITKATTGSEDEWTTWSMSRGTGCRLLRLKQR